MSRSREEIMSGPIEIVLILAAVCYVMVRRMIGEPAQGKRMLILPAVLVVIGLSDVSGQLKTPLAILFLLATAAISVVIGALRGASVRISQRDGLAFIQYTWVTVALWAANLVIKFGANFVLGAVDPKDAAAVSNSLFLTLGAGMLVEGLVVLSRALRGGTRVMWSQGNDGQPHRMSPTLDNLGRNLNGGSTHTYPTGAESAEYGQRGDGQADWNNQPGYDQADRSHQPVSRPADGFSSLVDGLRDARGRRRGRR